MMNGHGDDERRELARLFDEQDKLLAEAKAEREYKELTRRVGESGLAFRDQEPESEINWDGWERWRSGHENLLREEISKALDQEHDNVDKALAQSLEEVYLEIDRRVGTLENENRELRGMLGEALSRFAEARKIAEAEAQKQHAAIERLERQELVRRTRDATITERSNRISELMRDNAASRAELARQQFDQAFAVRDARLRTMEEKFAMLLQFLSLQGLDPPKF
jgi:SMC interacting uncharacterized protein involved in chromosome segregation